METNTNIASKTNDAIRFYSIFEVMKITGLSRVSIYRRIKDNTIKATKLGRRVLVPASFIEELMTEGRTVLSTEEDTV